MLREDAAIMFIDNREMIVGMQTGTAVRFHIVSSGILSTACSWTEARHFLNAVRTAGAVSINVPSLLWVDGEACIAVGHWWDPGALRIGQASEAASPARAVAGIGA
jgi:hypothetical protein